MKKIVEICCGSYEDCLNAYRGGAKRVELNSALYLGGLTASLAALRLTKQNTDLKVIAMVRARGAGFFYNEEEIQEMMLDAELLLENGADGIAFGFLNNDGTVNVLKTKKMVELIHRYGKEAVFHRAFDCCQDPFATVELLIDLDVDRVLTSGLKNKAIEGCDLLKKLNEKYGEKIEFVAGSGMNATNAKELYEKTGITQIHSSCKSWREDPTTSKNEVSYRYHDEDSYEIVDENKVRELVDVLKTISE